MSRAVHWTSGIAVILVLLVAPCWAQELDPDPYDRTAAEACKVCHTGDPDMVAHQIQTQVQTFIYNDWINAGHANSWEESTANTYCINCHAPYQGDPNATHSDNTPVAIEDDEAVTCSICHPDHNVRVALGTPIGNYVVGTKDLPNADGITDSSGTPVLGTWIPVDPDKGTDLCIYCHQGSHHAPRALNHMKNFQCDVCHMPEVDLPVTYTDPVTGEAGTDVVQVRSHSWEFPLDDDVALAAKVEAACQGCHASWGWSVEDTIATIKAGEIHNDKPIPDAGGPYAGFVGKSITLDASASSDTEGDPLTFSWNFGDGSPVTEPSASPTVAHTYAEPGTFTASVTVTDALGNYKPAAKATVEVAVPTSDDWTVRLPLTGETLGVTFEPFAGMVIVQTSGGTVDPNLGVGMDMGTLIFWMNTTGEMFFGNINQDAGIMSGIVFGGTSGSGIFFAERM